MRNIYSSLFIATFSRYEKGQRLPTNGFVEPFLSFFLPKVKSITLLDGPHPISDIINPIIENYNHGALKKRYMLSQFIYFPIYLFCKTPSKKTTRLSYKIRDFFAVLFLGIRANQRYDLFIGLEGVYALGGIVLRKLGKVRTVVYYVSDYAPQRFGKTLFNRLYIMLDRFCVMHSDFTWDVSPAMQKARIEGGLHKKYFHKVIHVPNGLFPFQIKSLPLSQRMPNSLVYMGILDPDMGPDFAIKAMSEVTKKIKNAKLHIIGGVLQDVLRLQKIAAKLQLEKNVIFYGFINDNEKMAQLVQSCMVGLAPYRSFPDSFRWWGDAGKIRQYIASGLPVVTTHVPPLGHYIVEKEAGIMRNDTIKDFSDGIIQLLSDKKLYEKLAKNAEYISKKNTWENSYGDALRKMNSTLT